MEIGPRILMLAAALSAPTMVWAADADNASENAARLVVVGDFNRDGLVDRAEITLPGRDRSEGLLTLALGRADGTFRETALKLSVGRKPKGIVAGDFNGDGTLDVIVGDGDGALMLFAGDGTGNLAVAEQVGRFASIASLAAADFNHDGISDLVVSDSRASTVTVLLGARHGSFQGAGSFPLRTMGTSPHVAVADFNGDGIPDLAVVYDNEDGDTFDVLLGNGRGSFTPAPELSRVRDPNAHCVT